MKHFLIGLVYVTVLLAPFVIFVFSFRKLGAMEKSCIVLILLLIPLFLVVNDMFVMGENDEFIQLKSSPFLFIYKHIFSLSKDECSYIKDGGFYFLHYPQMYGELFWIVNGLYFAGFFYFSGKLVKLGIRRNRDRGDSNGI